MSSISIVVSLFLFAAAVTGQNPSNNCPVVTPFSNLESTRLSGEWTALYGLNVGIVLPEISCLKATVSVDPAGILTTTATIMRNNERIIKNSIGTPIDGVRAKLSFRNTANPEKVEIATITDTDYDNYLVWLTCITKEGNHGYNVMVISKQTTLSQQLLDRIKESLRAANLIGELIAVPEVTC